MNSCREIVGLQNSVHFAVQFIIKLFRRHGTLEGLLVFVEDRVGRESGIVSLPSVFYHPVKAEDNEDGESELKEDPRRDDNANGDTESNAVLYSQLDE